MPNKIDIIRLLETELDIIEGGGYGRSVREPHVAKPMFKNSIICLNHWLLPELSETCEGCLLMDFVPNRHKQSTMPCHQIPLDEAGVTARELEESGDQERLEEAVKHWLRSTIKKLKDEVGQSEPSESLNETGIVY